MPQSINRPKSERLFTATSTDRDFHENPLGYTLAMLDLSSSPQTVAAAKDLLLEYGSFVASQPGVASFCFGALEEEARNLPASYLSQGGGVILAHRAAPSDSTTQETIWLGSIAWRAWPSQTQAGSEPSPSVEIKRLWVRPAARGLRLGRALVQAVIDRARHDGIPELLLDTAPSAMDCAFRLYRDLGFETIPCYSGRPQEGIVYMRKQL